MSISPPPGSAFISVLHPSAASFDVAPARRRSPQDSPDRHLTAEDRATIRAATGADHLSTLRQHGYHGPRAPRADEQDPGTGVDLLA